MGKLKKGSCVLEQDKPISPNIFVNEIYNDENRCVKNGRSHNMLTDLKIQIDKKELKTTKEGVSNALEVFQEEMQTINSGLAEKIRIEISKNLVRIDMVYNICRILIDSGMNDRILLSFKIYGELAADKNDSDVSSHDEYDSFYSMIKYWVISDHFNPTIRNEMIWDMLLSDFVCDMMRKKHSDAKGEILLLAKEFPYSKSEHGYTGNETNLKGPKVDYLVGIDDILYFVELKTSLRSFDGDQYDDYLRYATNKPEKGFTVEALWERYKKIVGKKTGRGDEHYYENSGTEKYRYQLDRMKRVCKKANLSDEAFFNWITRRYKEIRLTYITFDRLSSRSHPEESIDQIVLGDFKDDNLKIFDFGDNDDDVKKLRWGLVLDIIKGVTAGKMPQM